MLNFYNNFFVFKVILLLFWGFIMDLILRFLLIRVIIVYCLFFDDLGFKKMGIGMLV